MAKKMYVMFRRKFTNNPDRQDEELFEVVPEVFKTKKSFNKAVKIKSKEVYEHVVRDRGEKAYMSFAKHNGLKSSIIGFEEDGYHYDISYNVDKFDYYK